MINDLDVLLTALYVHVEDRVFSALGGGPVPTGPAASRALPDSELACLAVAQHLLGGVHLASMFPGSSQKRV